MIRKTVVVVIVAIVLLVVAIGGYILLTRTPSGPPGTAPTVSSVAPAGGAIGVAIDASIRATFSEAMDPATITVSTFLLRQGTSSVSGLVSYAGLTATFDPSGDLAMSTAYTATITTGAEDSSGVGLAANYVWSFTTTGPVVDTTPPLVTYTSPANAATGTPINAKILVVFNEAVNSSTITTSTFTLRQGATPVSGTVSYTGTTATFVPASNLVASTGYTATATNGIRNLAGLALAANFVWSFTTGPAADNQLPVVTFTSPAYGASGVAVNTKVLATFSEAMDPATITTSTFTLRRGATPLTGLVSYAGVTATFDPSGDLAASTAYTATITTGAEDLAGNALGANFVWGFSTGPVGDTTPPTVTFTAPATAATGVPVNTKVLATFSEAMDPTTITTSTFTLKQEISITGIVYQSGTSATFVPSNDLAASTLCTATITVEAKDLAGNPLQADFVWSFMTGPIPDTTPPRVVSTSPVLAVPLDSDVAATFSEAMDPATITVSTFLVAQGNASVLGLVSYAGLSATFDPVSNFTVNTTYTATITTGAKDLAGNPMRNDFVWSFSTSSNQSACSQAPVVLGSAGGFAVLAGSTVTNTGPTTVTGDLGVSPGTAVTGFPPGNVIGAIHAGNPTAAGGIADLTIAYNDAAGRTLCPVTIAGNLGGLTLPPGLYKSTSSLEISSGDLTLDGQGDPNAVFIFQIASTFTTTAGRQVLLIGGANASNVFWQVGSSATLGTGSAIMGTIMADQSISFVTGATLNGRALARIAAVTLDSNTVTKPAP